MTTRVRVAVRAPLYWRFPAARSAASRGKPAPHVSTPPSTHVPVPSSSTPPPRMPPGHRHPVPIQVDMVDLAKRLGYGKIVIRFGDAESLVENLGVVQGHVTPLALANDTAQVVNVALDARLLAPNAGEAEE